MTRTGMVEAQNQFASRALSEKIYHTAKVRLIFPMAPEAAKGLKILVRGA
jgi:hypothetical protein